MPLLAFGSNAAGQLGLGHREDVSVPQRVHGIESEVDAIHGGGNHSVILLKDGSSYACGRNNYGQCAVESGDDDILYVHRTCMPPLKSLAAGWEFSVFVDHGGRVWTCGRGPRGELGSELTHNHVPRPVENLYHAKLVRCGVSFVLCLTETNDLYGWGDTSSGQVDPSRGSIRVLPPSLLASAVQDMACGHHFSVVLMLNGRIEVRTTKDRHRILSAVPTPTRPPKSLFATWNTAYVQCDDKSVECWGRGDKGQLIPRGLPPVSMIATGSEHCIALSQEGRVYAWGYNEHGNCGRSDRVDITGSAFEVQLDIQAGRCVFVGASSATSFIQILDA